MQRSNFFRLIFGAFLGLALVGASSPGWAVLGNALPAKPVAAPSSTVPNVKLLAIAAQGGQTAYTISETVLDGGTTVREFASPAGPVFAITWSGPLLPELGTLLGDYFSAFNVETSRARAEGRRGSPFVMERDGLVVRSGGRMGSFSGHAYVLKLIPADVNIKDVVQ